MKKIILSIVAIVALASSSFAQTSPLLWQVSENTKVKIGGFVRMNVNYDFDGSVTGNDFISNTIPTSTTLSSEDRLNYDATATRLSMTLTQSTSALGDINVYVEGDFRGTSNTIRLRQAYVEAKGFIAGQAWSFMTDLAAQAPTIDINGVGSRTFFRTNLIGYRRALGQTLSAGIALEVPTLVTSYAGEYYAVNQRTPNIPVYIQAKGGVGHIKAAVAFRSLEYGTSSNERENLLGVAGQLSGSLKAGGAVTLFGQAIYGKGINNYISDMASLSVNLMSVDGIEMEATPMGGASLGASAKLSKKWLAAVSGSLTQNYGDEAYFEGDYKSTSYLSALVRYFPMSALSVGLEYLNGSRTNFGGDASSAQRLSFSVMYTL
ncbi:MAG: DcaP family trimeric outer membrane transporter [Rikenellaceae bacterium]